VVAGRERETRVRVTALARKRAAAAARLDAAPTRAHAIALGRAAGLDARRRDLARLSATLAAHDPQRTLERGYALVEDPAGEPVTSAAAAREQAALTIRLHDGRVDVRR
jgi:exodeoxyribonuclease VII large subunit